MASIKLSPSTAEFLTSSKSERAAARRSSSGQAGLPSPFFDDEKFELVDSRTLTVKASARRTGVSPAVEFSLEGQSDDAYVTVFRHESGAISFHFPDKVTPKQPPRRRSGKAVPSTAQPVSVYEFRCPVRVGYTTTPTVAGSRRGLFSRVIKVFVMKVVSAVVDHVTSWAIGQLAAIWEQRTWSKRGLQEGWHRITPATLRSGRLTPVDMKSAKPAGRSLVFFHGTFSNTARAFGQLEPSFFQQIRSIYGDNLFGFNHYTISKTPEENATELLQALSSTSMDCDVITHSRGGLVLRNITERPETFGALAQRMRIEKAILVASPNDGTPLATPQRWQDTVGFFANILEMLPENPFTTAAEFVTDAIVWIAKKATGNLPGIASMDKDGPSIAALQAPPGPTATDYFALVANYHPDDSLTNRLKDVGLDYFFGMSNDMVVPSEGGWQVGNDLRISGSRIGCFGAGGNLDSGEDVHHGNFFKLPETQDFLVNVLTKGSTELSNIDPNRPLPDRRFRRSSSALNSELPTAPTLQDLLDEVDAPARETFSSGLIVPDPDRATPVTEDSRMERYIPISNVPLGSKFSDSTSRGSALNLVILPPPPGMAPLIKEEKIATILATYANARVREPFRTKGGLDGERFRKIIATNRVIEDHIDGKPGASLPSGTAIMNLGINLFEALFPGNVRRIYDVARSSYQGDRLPVILTSMIHWVADMPWEFAFDPSRNSFLATEEIHFIRNVLTAIPAEEVEPVSGPLRILVVVAQPVGQGNLSSEQEIRLIKRSFETLIDSGLVAVTVLPKATPAKLHSMLGRSRFDVVHCICHGEYDSQEDRGYLVFETGTGRPHRLDERVIREIFCQRGIRLVFLNACETSRGTRKESARFNSGVAQALVAGGMPAVVANQYKVLDLSATAFSKHFYWCVANGMSLGEAAREARISVRYTMNSEPIDWAVPVLYSRNSETRLCRREKLVSIASVMPSIASALPRQLMSSAQTQQAHVVGVWDVNLAFPELEKLLAKLNQTQNKFHFRTVSSSLPLSSMVTFADDPVQYMYTDAVAEKISSLPEELGVDSIACMTDQPMACRDNYDVSEDDSTYTTNIYAWSDEQGGSPISIFSMHGLDLPVVGIGFERAIASALVFALASQLAGADTCSGDTTECPMYYNESRDTEIVTGPHRFGSQCKRFLQETIPDDLPALESILKATD